MMTFARATLILALSISGCSSSDSARDTSTAADSGGRDVGFKPDSGVKPEAGIKPEGGIKPDGAANSIQVTYGGNTIAVDLSKPQPVTLQGAVYARLSDVVLLALPQKTLDVLTADFAADDGYMPGMKSNCKGLTPIAGDKLAKGYVERQSHDMLWEADLNFPGCMALNGLAKIIIADK